MASDDDNRALQDAIAQSLIQSQQTKQYAESGDQENLDLHIPQRTQMDARIEDLALQSALELPM